MKDDDHLTDTMFKPFIQEEWENSCSLVYEETSAAITVKRDPHEWRDGHQRQRNGTTTINVVRSALGT